MRKCLVNIVDIPPEVIGYCNFQLEKVVPEEYDLSVIPAPLLEHLLPFQKEGLHFGIKNDGRVLIADEMGLGKTIQSIALAIYYKSDWPLLIVCPCSLKKQWYQVLFFINLLIFFKSQQKKF